MTLGFTTDLQLVARLLHQIRRIYWKLFRPITLGVSALVIDHSNHVLLVQNSYRRGWHLPGGGVHKSEHLVDAVTREIVEEARIDCSRSQKDLLGVYSNFSEGNFDYVSVFVIREFVELGDWSPSLEISDRRYFEIEDLPADIGQGTKRRILEFLKRAPIAKEW